jgi:phospholipid/cholesterol/gamma-HCH transport system permease protein
MNDATDSLPVAAVRRVGSMTLFLGRILARILPALRRPGLIVAQIYNAGARSLVIISEIGLMKSTEQLTAMQMMAVDPVRYVVVPRFLGGFIAMPLLSATFTVIALYGAQLIGVQQMGVDAGAYWSQTQNAVDLHDVWEGVVKSLVFGVAVSLVAVYEGYHSEPTPEGVGLATTRTVVVSSVLVLLLNYLLTAAFLTTH